MEHAHLEELVGSNQYVADEGYVITNYVEGESERMIYSPGLIFAKGSEPQGFYTMLETEAAEIAERVNPKPVDHEEEIERMRLHDMEEDMMPEDLNETNPAEEA